VRRTLYAVLFEGIGVLLSTIGLLIFSHDDGMTTGLAVLIVKNVTNSGNLLVLDLVGDTSTLDRAGRPTRFNWTVNGASGGTFSGATGQGTLEVLYRPDGRAQARTGSVGLIFRGSVDTNGVSDILLT